MVYINFNQELEKRSSQFVKKYKICVESWCSKLLKSTNNRFLKRNRNLHTILLLNMVINNKLCEPYNQVADNTPIPLISKNYVESQLSDKFIDQIVKEIDSKYQTFISCVCQSNPKELKKIEKELRLMSPNKDKDRYNIVRIK